MDIVQVFPSEEFGDIRTMLIDGKEYFCGNDIAKGLCYSSPKNAVTRHCKGALFRCLPGETQEMKFIPVGDVYRLIVKASSQSNNEEIKEKASRFESLVFDTILPQIHKTGGYGTPKTIPEQIQLLAQGNVELNKRVDSIQTELEELKLDLPILPIEADRITEAVLKRGVSILGGKQSPAYNNKGLRTRLYNNLYANLKYNFNIKSYKSIKRCQCDKAVEIIMNYQPPFYLAEQIANTNAQQSLNLEGGV